MILLLFAVAVLFGIQVNPSVLNILTPKTDFNIYNHRCNRLHDSTKNKIEYINYVELSRTSPSIPEKKLKVINNTALLS